MTAIVEHNRRAWDGLARSGHRFARPATDQEFSDPLKVLDSWGWYGGSVKGKQLLCLAAGGGRYGPLFAAAGAIVTIADASPEMLALDRRVCAERRLEARMIEASMDDLSALQAGSFDIVVQPVSSCYVPNVRAVYHQVARVTVPGGLYVSQHKQPASLQAAPRPGPRGYELVEPYYRSGPLPSVEGAPHREPGTLEFLHRWEELVGGLCRAGFVVEDLVEPVHADEAAPAGSFAHRCRFVPPYVRIRARRSDTPATGTDPLVIPAAV